MSERRIPYMWLQTLYPIDISLHRDAHTGHKYIWLQTLYPIDISLHRDAYARHKSM